MPGCSRLTTFINSIPLVMHTAASSLLLTTALLIGSCSRSGEAEPPAPQSPTPLTWQQPAHFPEPVYDFSLNPLTREGVELGRHLFYDGLLSRTNIIGCGTCHQQQAAFTHHGHELSHGVDDRLGTRNAPAVQNMAWQRSFFWDGGVHDLDFVPIAPIENPVEMDERLSNVLEKLRNTPHPDAKKPIDYPRMYRAAFGDSEITTARTMKALSQFMLTMVSATSRYDYYKMGDANALGALEKQGMVLFQQHCASCHTGELFSDFSYRNNGLSPLKIQDKGRFEVTGQEDDQYKFKVPSLRNAGLTAPYMHDGRYYSLEAVLDHYTDNVRPSATLDPLLVQADGTTGLPLTAGDKQALIAFLHTLSDEQFIRDTRLSDPGIGNAL